MISTICFVISVSCILLAAFRKRDIFSPIYIYLITQSLTLGIAYLQLDKTMTDFKPFTWLVLLGGSFAFSVGCAVARLHFHANPSQIFSPLAFTSKHYHWKLHHSLSWFIYLLVLCCSIPAVSLAGGIPLLSHHLHILTSQKMNIGYFTYGYNSGPIAVFLFSISSFKKLCPHKGIALSSRIMTGISLCTLVLLNPTRNSLFFALGLILINWNFLKKRIDPWLLPLGFALMIPVFIALGYAKSQYTDADRGATMKHVLHLPYIYLACNYWNLDYALNPDPDNEIHPFTWGLDATNGFSEIIYLGGSIRTAFDWDNAFNHRIEKTNGLNTVSYLWQSYKDFWVLGVAAIPFLAGLILTWLYQSLRQKFSLIKHMIYALCLYIVGWWWFTESYKNGLYLYWVLALLLIGTLCSNWRNRDHQAQLC